MPARMHVFFLRDEKEVKQMLSLTVGTQTGRLDPMSSFRRGVTGSDF